ncbi:pro-cathepsin H [Latimeria chalumnae]|uniref:Pro-cathepsin H n=1 Tax=Latimeria chalumnae TaxID=7897 RepID=H3A9Q4_LATCH|nr:PREDICTED: pro-cathepsin H [Latimeria chalumnae]|eukprot:XP_005999744.1 PREDICTED: pro-cathepsin H [Latimeria chalumnae]
MWREVVLIAAVVHSTACRSAVSSEEELRFKSWISEYNKNYSMQEYYHRLQIFVENKRKVDKHNAGNHTFRMGLNQFSDLTFKEFKKLYLWTEPQNCSATQGNYDENGGPYPDFVDWRKEGNYVTPVKNQGPCGSCWTFSTTGCLESVIAIATNKLPSLSEQQLVDCAQAFNNHGCSGGLPSQAFEYIKYNKGLMTEKDYPYKARNGTCKFKPDKAAVFVKDVVNITIYDELGMVDAVAKYNPVSFAFEVTENFMLYKDGVYSNPHCHSTPDKVNHAVLAVGYGKGNGSLYWIVKNSWGPYWGINGYFYIERGKNMCGLAACASYPIPQL